jgi:hypothetical protein
MGADGAIAETLTWGSFALSRLIVGGERESFVNPIAKMREIDADPEGMVNGELCRHWNMILFRIMFY